MSHSKRANFIQRLVLAGCLVAGVLPARAHASAPEAHRVEDSVVKVFSTIRQPDTSKPWTKQSPQEATGTGVIIEGHRILTNAHVVLYASQVQVQANQAGDKISATVEAIAPGIDLAVLKLEEDAFFDNRAPLKRASLLPEVKDAVMAYGFPTGGSSLSITKGIVSRIEFTGYNYPVTGLRIQIDAAINPGNSGGPAVVGDKMIGLAYSTLGGAQNIGYIIPCEEIELFLKDIEQGHYQGKPALFDDLQTLENPSLRAYLKLDKGTQGIVVHEPFRGVPSNPLKPWDLITRIGDTPVDDQGMVKVGANLRVRFHYLIQKTARRGAVPLTVVRDGKEQAIQMPVASGRKLLIPDLQGAYPSYFVLGPLVFSVATAQFVNGNSSLMGRSIFYGSPLATRRGEDPAFPGEELVIIASPFLPHRLAKGYSNPFGEVVKSVNGTSIKNLRHLVQTLRELQDDFLVLAFARSGAESMIFPRKEMLTATEEILTDNGIRSQGSPDVLSLWNALAR